MSNEQFSRERRFNAALWAAFSMLSAGVITPKEYAEIRSIFVQKYCPVIGGLSPVSLDFQRV